MVDVQDLQNPRGSCSTLSAIPDVLSCMISTTTTRPKLHCLLRDCGGEAGVIAPTITTAPEIVLPPIGCRSQKLSANLVIFFFVKLIYVVSPPPYARFGRLYGVLPHPAHARNRPSVVDRFPQHPPRGV